MLQGVLSNYETDLFTPLIAAAVQLDALRGQSVAADLQMRESVRLRCGLLRTMRVLRRF